MLVESVIIKRPDLSRSAAEVPDVCGLCSSGVDQRIQSQPPVELQRGCGFLLCLAQWLARHEQVPDEDRTARGGRKRITRLAGAGDSAAEQLTAGSAILRPWCLYGDNHSDRSLELPQAVSLDELMTQSTEAEADLDVAK